VKSELRKASLDTHSASDIETGLSLTTSLFPAASVATSAALSAVKPGNPAGADSIEAELQVLLTMASILPQLRK